MVAAQAVHAALPRIEQNIFFERGQFNDLVTLRGNQDLSFITHFPVIVQSGDQVVDITTNSIFGQLRYKIVPQVEIAAGVRLADEKRTDTATDFTTGVAIPITAIGRARGESDGARARLR